MSAPPPISLATFLYDNTRVSAWRFQIVQGNVPWGHKYDGWGQAYMSYTPGGITDEEALRAQFTAELQQQTPIRPWADLAASFAAPGLEHFDGDTAPADLKASGMIVDGVIYLRGCETRAGPYPSCRQMRHKCMTTYAAGLRGGAVVRRHRTDHARERMVSRVTQGQGHTDRSPRPK